MEQNGIRTASQIIRIMVVGNNPLELSKLLARIQKINDRKVEIDFAFDMQSIVVRFE